MRTRVYRGGKYQRPRRWHSRRLPIRSYRRSKGKRKRFRK